MASVVCVTVVALVLLTAGVPEPQEAEYIRIERLSERVLLAYGVGTGRCNLTAIQSERGLVVIDTEMSPRIMAPIRARIEKEFGRSDWAYVINTHAHMHHAGGNSVFEGVPVVGHENLPQDMEWLVRKQAESAWKQRDLAHRRQTLANLHAALPGYSRHRPQSRRIRGEIRFWQLYLQDVEEGYDIVRPTVTFADRHTLDLGDLVLELVFFGKGHSLSDILVYVPQERLLVTGAIVYQRAHLPEIGEASELADVHRFMAVLDGFLAENVRIDRVVPSHSPPLRKSDLAPVRDYYHRMLAGVQAARRDGLTLDETMSRLALRTSFRTFREPPPGDWAHGMHERNVRNLWRSVTRRTSSERSGAAYTIPAARAVSSAASTGSSLSAVL
jgi:glyoxylase-like metal-dependent hydrolase (beta-lactamase superfamily II)